MKYVDNYTGVVVHSGCCNITIAHVVYKQKFISHSSRGWRVQDQVADRFGVWCEPTSLFIDSFLLTMSSHSRRNEGALWSH